MLTVLLHAHVSHHKTQVPQAAPLALKQMLRETSLYQYHLSSRAGAWAAVGEGTGQTAP